MRFGTQWDFLVSALIILQVKNLSAIRNTLNEGTLDNMDTAYPDKPVEIYKNRIPEIYSRLFRVIKEVSTAKIEERLTYHACCQSALGFVTYDQLVDINGKLVTLVTYGNRKQYFYSETCVNSDKKCTCNCFCMLVNQVITVLVYNPLYQPLQPDKLILTLAEVPTFCRCFNNAKQGAKQDPELNFFYDSDLSDTNF
ncbi:uncharacterized protein LOC131942521 [Physella acuta]|uniref:uncharacterized protein LOC131942521 n=1 Tax=Physella acuta TaxID=109671 RepID=UPI0027DAE7BF|nr:uncharacterized protein LOC131942521 [Physella acuta]